MLQNNTNSIFLTCFSFQLDKPNIWHTVVMCCNCEYLSLYINGMDVTVYFFGHTDRAGLIMSFSLIVSNNSN